MISMDITAKPVCNGQLNPRYVLISSGGGYLSEKGMVNEVKSMNKKIIRGKKPITAGWY